MQRYRLLGHRRSREIAGRFTEITRMRFTRGYADQLLNTDDWLLHANAQVRINGIVQVKPSPGFLQT
jgi:hypothetical protein